MVNYRVEKDGETFYVQPDTIERWQDEGYTVYRTGSSPVPITPGGLTPQSDGDETTEHELEAEDVAFEAEAAADTMATSGSVQATEPTIGGA